MEIVDFLPKYPSTHPEPFSPYDENFYLSLFKKKEFYDNRLFGDEEFPKQTGWLTKYQSTIARYLSSNTPYSSLLVIHAPGSGKSCSAIAAIEQIKSENSGINGALILASSESLLRNFQNEIANKCTAGDYLTDSYIEADTDKKKNIRLGKAVGAFYKFQTFIKHVRDFTKDKEGIAEQYSNKVIVIDEVHGIRIQNTDNPNMEENYQLMYEFLHKVRNCKIILMSGTPMNDRVEEIAAVMNLIIPESQKLPIGKQFVEEFLERKKGITVVKESKKEVLKNIFKGRISFLKEDFKADVKKRFLGSREESKKLGLKYIIVKTVEMSEFQTKAYNQAYEEDMSSQKSGVYDNSENASLFVFPNGSYGSRGWEKYVKITSNSKKLTTEDVTNMTYSFSSDEIPDLIKLRTQKEQSDKILELLDDKNADIDSAVKYYRDNDYKKVKQLLPKTVPFDKFKKMMDDTTERDNKEKLRALSEYSSYYAEIIKHILNTKGKCFLFCSNLRGSGAIVFCLLLQLFGFESTNGSETYSAPRYALISSESHTPAGQKKIMEAFDKPENYLGERIKVMIGTRVISQGFSLKDIKFEGIIVPHWNYTETFQALARGIRLGSHRYLLNHDPKFAADPYVNILQLVNIPKKGENEDEQKFISLFAHMYKLSEDKDISIKNMLRLLIESAIDCSLNYIRNRVVGKDDQPECEYMKCSYKCDGVKMDQIIDEITYEEDEDGDIVDYKIIPHTIPNDKLDYSTYNLFYLNPVSNKIFEKIEAIFRHNDKLTLKNIVDYLSEDYSKIQISKALKILLDTSTDSKNIKEQEKTFLTFENFRNIYTANTLTYKIIYSIEQIFLGKFKTDYEDIKQWTLQSLNKEIPIDDADFIIITVLNKIVNEQINIRNKYGIYCYLKEKDGIYFLVENIEENIDNVRTLSYTEYYTKNIHVCKNIGFPDALRSLGDVVENNINKLCSVETQEQFSTLITTFDFDIQETLLENVVKYFRMNQATNIKFCGFVLAHFNQYITTTATRIFSALLLTHGKKNILRVVSVSEDGKIGNWRDAEPLDKLELSKTTKSERERFKNNEYGLYGLFNAETDSFCIVDYNRKSETGRDMNKDTRTIATGRRCDTWSIPDLQSLIINRLKIAPPKSWIDSWKESDIDTDVLESLKMTKVELTSEVKQRIDYWRYFGGGKGKLCSTIFKFLKDAGLIDFKDTTCGAVRRNSKLEGVNIDKKGVVDFSIKIFTKEEINEDDNILYYDEIDRLLYTSYGTSLLDIKFDRVFIVSKKLKKSDNNLVFAIEEQNTITYILKSGSLKGDIYKDALQYLLLEQPELSIEISLGKPTYKGYKLKLNDIFNSVGLVVKQESDTDIIFHLANE